jgi:hypothetical protein
MRYSSIISNANCSSQMVLANTTSADSIDKGNVHSFRKVFVSEVFEGKFQLVIENDLFVESCEIIISDKNSEVIVYSATIDLNDNFNRFDINIGILNSSEYMLTIRDVSGVLLQYPLLIIYD